MNKEQLKQIIKEELRKYMNEAEPAPAQTQNQPNMLELYNQVMQDNSNRSTVENLVAAAKRNFIWALEHFESLDVARLKKILNTFDVQLPLHEPDLNTKDEQFCNRVMFQLLRNDAAMQGHKQFYNRGQYTTIMSYISEKFKENRILREKFEYFFKSTLIKQIKNDPAVRQAVAKAKEQIESGDVPTAKGAQFQPKGAPVKPAPKV